jgi:CheY-like chemotaxis protein
MSASPVVAVFDTSPDTVDILRIILERAGFVVVAAFTYELRDGEVDIEAFCQQHQPAVAIYDIALPYDANWRLFEHIRSLDVMRDTKFVVTTTNEKQVRAIAGPTEKLIELVGKPYDLGLIVEAVKKAAGTPVAASPSGLAAPERH